MRHIILTIALLLLTVPATAQNDITGTHTQQWTINLQWGAEFLAADSTDLVAIPAGAVIKSVYWHTDSLTTGLDSLQLRLGSSQVIVHSYPVALEIMETVRYNQTWYAITTDQRLRLHRFSGAPCTGQVRITVEWITLN